MIKIDFSLAVALYLILTTGLVFLAIILEGRKAQKQFSSEKNFLWQCSICTYVYVDSMHVNISQCPRCGSYNNKEEKSLHTDVSKKGGTHA
ncbi:MAG: hypothetical protein Q8O12_04530 [Candidatus Omnitrophota bacterium]|nr:hypothetical protein [Candidatus Omnitrophota bacterium]